MIVTSNFSTVISLIRGFTAVVVITIFPLTAVHWLLTTGVAGGIDSQSVAAVTVPLKR
jgi:hypothetical protein